MDELITKIEQDIDTIKVISQTEQELPTSSNYMILKKGEYALNNGNIIHRERMIKKFGTGNAVCIFAVTVQKKILLVLQSRVSLPTKTKVSVEIPAGYIEETEDSESAATRELVEETGYTFDQMMMVDQYYPSLGFSGERIDLFLALDCQKVSAQHLDKDEFICCEEVTLEEFEYLLNHHYIKDANTRIGYYRYLEYLMEEGY